MSDPKKGIVRVRRIRLPRKEAIRRRFLISASIAVIAIPLLMLRYPYLTPVLSPMLTSLLVGGIQAFIKEKL